MIYTAVIKSNYDWSRTGKALAECNELGYGPCEVKIVDGIQKIRGSCVLLHYTSPFFQNFKSGIFAPPAENSEVLIYHNSKDNRSFYLSTIIAGPSNLPSTKDSDQRKNPVVNPLEYYQDAEPAGMSFKDAKGDGLGIYLKRSEERYINKTEVVNGKKKFLLDSSPEVDCVKIDNGHGDYIKINGIPESSIPGVVQPSPNRSIEARTMLNQHFISDRGELDFKIMDGKEITLENRSSGFFSFGPFAPRTGNINLFSKYKNINIVAKAPFYVPSEGPISGGKIMIQTANSEIIVSRDGVTIQLNTAVTPTYGVGAATVGIGRPKIELKASTGDVIIDAGNPSLTTNVPPVPVGGRIVLKGAQIELLAPSIVIGGSLAQNVTMTAPAGSVNIDGGVVNIDGTPLVNLNSQAARGVNQPVIQTAELNPNVPPVNVTPSEYPTGTKYF